MHPFPHQLPALLLAGGTGEPVQPGPSPREGSPLVAEGDASGPAAGEPSHALVPATAARSSRTKAALPASTCAAQGPSLRHCIHSLTGVVQETSAPGENCEWDRAGRTLTVPRAGILGSRDKKNS